MCVFTMTLQRLSRSASDKQWLLFNATLVIWHDHEWGKCFVAVGSLCLSWTNKATGLMRVVFVFFFKTKEHDNHAPGENPQSEWVTVAMSNDRRYFRCRVLREWQFLLLANRVITIRKVIWKEIGHFLPFMNGWPARSASNYWKLLL